MSGAVREVLLGIRTVAEMIEAFADEEWCRRLLEALVWSNGRVCPAWGYKRSIALAGRDQGRFVPRDRRGARVWQVLFPAAVLALGLGGLPLTGGALAKLALKAQFGESVVGTLAELSAAGSTLLMLHFLRRLAQMTRRASAAAAPAGYTGPWLIMAVMAVAVPWALFPATGSGSSLQVLSLGPFWSALWPVMIGGVLALGLWRWTDRLPRVPAGDIVVAGEAAVRSVVPWGEAIERADAYLRRWPVASLLLLSLLIVLAAARLGGR